MARFDDMPSSNSQDQGFRSDEVKGPFREAWARETPETDTEKTDSIGGSSGLGDAKNPAWAGAQANLESDTAGRGAYGTGEEGSLGYGEYKGGGEMPSSPTKSSASQSTAEKSSQGAGESAEHRHVGHEGGGNYGTYDIGGKGAEGFHRVANGNYDDVLDASGAGASEGFGTRHWGHGEYKGDDSTETHESKSELIQRAVEKVGQFFGIGPKGYTRSDARIHEDICECLQSHHEINAAEVEVEVKGGVVKLSGTVDDRAMRRLTEDAISRIPGIREVENHLGLANYVARTEEADQLKSGEIPPTLHS